MESHERRTWSVDTIDGEAIDLRTGEIHNHMDPETALKLSADLQETAVNLLEDDHDE